jgi:hypothetical protein
MGNPWSVLFLPEVPGEKNQYGIDFQTSGQHAEGQQPFSSRWNVLKT